MLSIRLLHGFVTYYGIIMPCNNLLVESNVSIKKKKNCYAFLLSGSSHNTCLQINIRITVIKILKSIFFHV
jgi:hypothetical protein